MACPLLAEADRKQTRAAPPRARLAQLVERKALNLVVVGSSPTVGVMLILGVVLLLISVQFGGTPSQHLRSSAGGRRVLSFVLVDALLESVGAWR